MMYWRRRKNNTMMKMVVMGWVKVYAQCLKLTVGWWCPGLRRQSHFRTFTFKTWEFQRRNSGKIQKCRQRQQKSTFWNRLPMLGNFLTFDIFCAPEPSESFFNFFTAAQKMCLRWFFSSSKKWLMLNWWCPSWSRSVTLHAGKVDGRAGITITTNHTPY